MSAIMSLADRAVLVARNEGVRSLLQRTKRYSKMRFLSFMQKSSITESIYHDRFQSPEYWEWRYADGRPSGPGSEGEYARFKAEVLNEFIEEHDIESVVEFGCGDGRQIELIDYPEYVGLEVTESALDMCFQRFPDDPSKSFFLYDPLHFSNQGAITAELVVSLEVIFHLVEDEIFEQTMQDMFDAAGKYVVVFSSDHEKSTPELHIRHRKFTEYVANEFPNFELINEINNTFEERHSDFYIYKRTS